MIGLDGAGAGGLEIGGITNTSDDLYIGGAGSVLVTTGGNLSSQDNIRVGRNGATGTLTVRAAPSRPPDNC